MEKFVPVSPRAKRKRNSDGRLKQQNRRPLQQSRSRPVDRERLLRTLVHLKPPAAEPNRTSSCPKDQRQRKAPTPTPPTRRPRSNSTSCCAPRRRILRISGLLFSTIWCSPCT